MDEILKFDKCIDALAESGGRALAAIVSKFRTIKNVGYETFTKLYHSNITPILDYESDVRGLKKSK